MQIFTSAVSRLLFIAGENAELIVVTVEEQCIVAENLLYKIALFFSWYLLQYPWHKMQDIIFGAT